MNTTITYINIKATQVRNDKDAAGICAAANLYSIEEEFELNPPETTACRTIFAFIEKLVTQKTALAPTRPIAICAQCLTLDAQSE